MNHKHAQAVNSHGRSYRVVACVLIVGFVVVAVGYVVGSSLVGSQESVQLASDRGADRIPPGYEPADPDWPDGPVLPEGVADKAAEELTSEDVGQIIGGYEATNRIPVDTEGGAVVGYMRYDEYYADRVEAPPHIEVWSYESEELVGYNVVYLGFAPISEFPPGVAVADVIADKYGDQIQAATDDQQQIDESIDELVEAWEHP